MFRYVQIALGLVIIAIIIEATQFIPWAWNYSPIDGIATGLLFLAILIVMIMMVKIKQA